MNWACGTRRNSAWAPGTSPYSLLNPNSAAPMPWSRTWVVSHCVCSPCVHIQQCPQQIWNGITTRSPTCRSPVSGPTSSTMPIGSWPRMSPSPMNGSSVS